MAGTYTITVLPAHQGVFVLGFEPRISRVLGERHNQARPYEQASNEGRTRDLALTKRMLCQLSYRGISAATATNFRKLFLEVRIEKVTSKKNAATWNRTRATGATSLGTAPIL